MISGLGCTFARSTPLKRIGGDDYAASSNGDPRRKGQPRPFRGIPAVLEVPTHYAVRIFETSYVYRTDGNNIHEVSFRNPGSPRLLDVDIKTISRKKLFSVDFARPAGGTLSASMSFNGAGGKATTLTPGHITSINNTVDEQTINQITTVLGQGPVKALFGKDGADGAKPPVATRANAVRVKKTVAYAQFDVDDPGVADQITAFLHHHISACHGCDGGLPCEPEPIEEIPRPMSSDTDGKDVVTQVAFTQSAPNEANALVNASNAVGVGKGLRAVLRESDVPYFTTDAFTIYDVEVAYE
jgi:hypothetical protein